MSRKRKSKDVNDDSEQMGIFGYSSKLFARDGSSNPDEAGLMKLPYNEDITVDRYDCRLLLNSNSDLSTYTRRFSGEIDFEEFSLDADRYADLVSEPREPELPAPPAAKKKNEIPYSYASSPSSASSGSIEEEDAVIAPFRPADGQFFPSGMTLPESHKQALVIERTALFVDEKGDEFEAIIRQRSATTHNLKFILNEHPLRPFYDHIRGLMKDGLYVRMPLKVEPKEDPKSDVETENEDGDYLNPLLMKRQGCTVNDNKSAAAKPKVTVPSKKEELSLFKMDPSAFNVDKKLYFKWYEKFYGGPSPYYPTMPPKLLNPSERMKNIILSHVKMVAANGQKKELEISKNTPVELNFTEFTHPYYLYYQIQLYLEFHRLYPLVSITFPGISYVPEPPPPVVVAPVPVPVPPPIPVTTPAPVKRDHSVESYLALGDDDEEEDAKQKRLARKIRAHEFLLNILKEKREAAAAAALHTSPASKNGE